MVEHKIFPQIIFNASNLANRQNRRSLNCLLRLLPSNGAGSRGAVCTTKTNRRRVLGSARRESLEPGDVHQLDLCPVHLALPDAQALQVKFNNARKNVGLFMTYETNTHPVSFQQFFPGSLRRTIALCAITTGSCCSQTTTRRRGPLLCSHTVTSRCYCAAAVCSTSVRHVCRPGFPRRFTLFSD